MLLTEQARRTEIMLFAIPTGKKVKFKASSCKANIYMRQKGVPKHPRHLNTSEKSLKNISPKLRQQSQDYNSMVVSTNYSKEKQ